MTKENPYDVENPWQDWEPEQAAWDDGHIIGYHSRDEVVDALVEALDDALVAIDPYQWAFTRERVKQAIAKAKP